MAPPHTRLIRLQRAAGRTRLGYELKRRLRGHTKPRSGKVSVPSFGAGELGARPNVLLVSHCDFTGNSALHAYRIASELHRRGFGTALMVPRNPRSVEDLGWPPFPVLSYRDVSKGRVRFPNGRGLGLVHAFTPREHVRRIVRDVVRAARCPYVVHLEDSDQAIGGSLQPEYLDGAAGITVVIERLLELKPAGVPGAVVWPGFEEAVLSPARGRDEVRAELGLGSSELGIVYTGNVHESNVAEVRELYIAVAQLRAAGFPAVLVKTGWNFVPASHLADLGEGLRDLGWTARARVSELIAAADVLVQPGRADPFNDYRFPSKLPDFLVSGRPVVLPRTNIGLAFKDGVEGLLLERGDAEEIRAKISLLGASPELGRRIGAAGRSFALRELRWSSNIDRVIDLYGRLRQSARAWE